MCCLRAQHGCQRKAVAVTYQVNLSGKSASASSQRMVFRLALFYLAPLFKPAPAADLCALTVVESTCHRLRSMSPSAFNSS